MLPHIPSDLVVRIIRHYHGCVSNYTCISIIKKNNWKVADLLGSPHWNFEKKTFPNLIWHTPLLCVVDLWAQHAVLFTNRTSETSRSFLSGKKQSNKHLPCSSIFTRFHHTFSTKTKKHHNQQKIPIFFQMLHNTSLSPQLLESGAVLGG